MFLSWPPSIVSVGWCVLVVVWMWVRSPCLGLWVRVGWDGMSGGVKLNTVQFEELNTDSSVARIRALGVVPWNDAF